MNTRVTEISIALLFAAVALLAPCRVAMAAQSVLVTGTVTAEFVHGNPFQTPHGAVVQSREVWEGSLVGTGIGHVFSSEFTPPDTSLNVASQRKLFTSDGNLFFSELGDRRGANVEVVSVIQGGTGLFKGATGTLTFTGILGGGTITFVYSGVIHLAD
jgi:hypothetical protein